MANKNQQELENEDEKTARYLTSHAPILLKQAVKSLEDRLQQDIENGRLWLQLGHRYRGLGELENASNAFSRAVELDYEFSLSNYLATLCDQNRAKLAYPSSEFIPTPFLLSFDFLTAHELNSAWQIFEERTSKFTTSRVAEDQIKKNTRDSIVLSGKKFEAFRDLFRTRIKPALKQAFETFDIEEPQEKRYQVQMTSHADGEFYRTHKDTDIGIAKWPSYPRVLSYVYYFNLEPKAFSGGELQLFDTNTTLGIASNMMTTIKPIHNSLIIFPSNYYHQVCTVRMPNIDRLWGRQTINGWLVDTATS